VLRRQIGDAGGDAARPGAGRQHHGIGRVLSSIGQHDAVDALPVTEMVATG